MSDKNILLTNPWQRVLDRAASRPDVWRSVTELLGDPELAEAMARELAHGHGDDEDPGHHHGSPHDTQTDHGHDHGGRFELGRRDLLKLLGASLALAGLPGVSGCGPEPADKILPHAQRPPGVVPAVPLEYATAMALDGFAMGLVVRTVDGRPIKIEGNPEHPASLGATDVYAQAAVLELYDPQRSRGVQYGGMPRPWEAFFRELAAEPRPGLRFLLPPQSSPFLAALMARVQQRNPNAGFVFYSPFERRAVYAGARQVFGRALEAQYDFRRARVVVSLDADFLASMPNSVRWSRDFAAARRVASPDGGGDGGMNRLYQVEAMPSPTGTLADHRLRARAGDVPGIAARILSELVALGVRPAGMPAAMDQVLIKAAAEDAYADWIRAVARDLRAHAGTSIVIAGDRQPAETHVLAHLINLALGNLGSTLFMTEPALLEPEGSTLADLVADMQAGAVDTLVILEGNPVYTAPADLGFAAALARVPHTAHLSLHHNQTSRACQWSLPAAHFLESWGDARAYDGTVSFVQPLIAPNSGPLFSGRSMAQILAAFAGQPDASMHQLLRDFWRERLGRGLNFADDWERYIQRGLIPASNAPAAVAAVTDGAWQGLVDVVARAGRPVHHQGLELGFEQSPSVYDGRFANNAWLLELPHPMTKLTWDNAAMLSPRTAARLGVDTEDVVELQVGERTVRAPALVVPGHADDAVTIALGYGQRDVDLLAGGVGVDAYALRTAAAPHFADGLRVTRTGDTYPLASTQTHFRLRGRELVLVDTLEGYRNKPQRTARHRGPLPSLLPEQNRDGQQWAMTIDTTICTGCSACVVACQAENNIPVVGKEGVRKSREMHWLRIDLYYLGPAEAPSMANQPMLCQHCEKAPCEYVCPVNATVHSPDGLNEMTYNRCIGTRFCSNNCPYKVRRFNWFEYTAQNTSVELQRNPSVTVRERGVMEKCTYCVQRIRAAEIQARMERRDIAPGEVVTACQQVCPTGAIQFGSLAHEDTTMMAWRGEPRVYAALHDQGTRPRTMYLAKIFNPNPELT